MTHPFDILPLPNGGKFIFTPCPGTKNANLSDSIATLKSAGANAVITMLDGAELKMLEVADLGEQVINNEMQWFQLPIADDCAPTEVFFSAFVNVKTQILAMFNERNVLAIHCRGGTGRTGLMAAILLLEAGYNWADVKNLIQAVRPKALTLEPHLTYLQTTYSI